MFGAFVRLESLTYGVSECILITREKHIMATTEQVRLEEQNRELRKVLAQLGVQSREKTPGETLHDENRRLQEDMRWYQRVLKEV